MSTTGPDRAEALLASVEAGYFGETFGINPKVGYNVDSFGHTASLPDILAELSADRPNEGIVVVGFAAAGFAVPLCDVVFAGSSRKTT